MSRIRLRKALFFTIGAAALLAAGIVFDTRAGTLQRSLQRAYLRDPIRVQWPQRGGQVRALEEKAVLFYFGAALGGFFALIAWFRPSVLEWRPEERAKT
jgi:hypothetical protein